MRLPIFTISLLLLVSVCRVQACGGLFRIDPKDHYLFYLGYPEEKYTEWKARTEKEFRAENIDYWHKYVNKKVSAKDVEEAIYSGQLPSSQYKFFNYLIENNDTLALKYWSIVNAPDNYSWNTSEWYYPTSKESHPESSSFVSNKLNINTVAQCGDKGLRDRFAFQLIRRAFHTASFKLCIDVWEKYGSAIPESALRTQCQSYYAGALYYTQREAEASVAFAEVGYFEQWLHYDIDVLRQVYRNQPNCPSLEFIVQQIVNAYFDKCNARDLGMADWVTTMKKKNEFDALANEVLADGKTNNPALWKSAQAAMEYIGGDKSKALKLINEASKMKGTDAVKENVRMMRTVFLAADNTTGKAYEKALLPDLKWLAEKVKSDSYYCVEHYMCFENFEGLEQFRMKVFKRVVLVEIVSHFEKLGQPERCLAYLNMFAEATGNKHTVEIKPLPKDADPMAWGAFMDISSGEFYYHEGYRTDYGTRFFVYADTARPETLKKYMAFINTKGKSDMDKFLLSNGYKDLDFCNELLGTKYIRMAQWDSAIAYLSKVPDKFLMTQNIIEFLPQRNPFREEWITNYRQGHYDLPILPAELYAEEPTKLNFCRIMKQLQDYTKSSDPTLRDNARYAYAVAMYQMTQLQAWPLTRYCYGVVNTLPDLYYEADMKTTHTQARELADKIISSSSDRNLTDKAFLLKYILLWPEAEYVFSYKFYNDWDHWQLTDKKRDRYYQLCVNALVKEWCSHNKTTLPDGYIYLTFCDTEQDHQ